MPEQLDRSLRRFARAVGDGDNADGLVVERDEHGREAARADLVEASVNRR